METRPLLVCFIAAVTLLRSEAVFAQQGNLSDQMVEPLACSAAQAAGIGAKPAELPIGTILTSILDVQHFPCTVAGTWIVANGRVLLPDQRLESIIRMNLGVYAALVDVTKNKIHAPNLQGVFLRGRDYTNDKDGKGNPDTVRLGEYQPDGLKAHTHVLAKTYPNLPHAPDRDADRRTLGSVGWGGYPDAVSLPEGGRETRPRNVTVNFYIRVD